LADGLNGGHLEVGSEPLGSGPGAASTKNLHHLTIDAIPLDRVMART
jgi:hypothetical protein